jgi:hypothetical protein
VDVYHHETACLNDWRCEHWLHCQEARALRIDGVDGLVYIMISRLPIRDKTEE